MLVALTGRAAQDAMRVATLENNVLEDPSQALEVADLTAGWPTNETTERLASIIQGLVCGTTLAKRMPFAKATTAIEDLADDANLRPGMADEASVDEREAAGTPLKECVICMAAPRSVRFACGHMLCCEDCTEDLINAVAQTSWGAQNKCPSCRARIVVVAQGGAIASQDEHDEERNECLDYTKFELETALRNYEAFHRLPIGRATVEQLQSSSAKIGGWLRAGQGREARASEQHAPVSGPPVACRRRMRLGVPLRSFGEAGQAADEATIEQLLRDTADPLPIAPGEWQGPIADVSSTSASNATARRRDMWAILLALLRINK
eukprot:jgi/Chrpa1/24814/Chrysochromulina_OHIO_Genome00028132-RA